MPDTPDPGARSTVADAIRASYPLMPYVLVLAGIAAACLGAPAEAWGGLVVGGAALIKPGHGE